MQMIGARQPAGAHHGLERGISHAEQTVDKRSGRVHHHFSLDVELLACLDVAHTRPAHLETKSGTSRFSVDIPAA